MKTLILAAGYATRLYPLTENTPKALLKIKGLTIMDHLLEKIEKISNVNEIIVITNNKFYNSFVTWAKESQKRIPISVLNDMTSSNETRLGAIGDILYAIEKKKIDEELLILASDNYFSFELLDFYNYYKEKDTDCVLGTEFEDLEYLGKNFAVAKLDEYGKILELKEKPIIPNSNIGVYASYIYKKDTVSLIKKYLDEGNNKDSPGNFPSWLYTKKPVHCYKFKGTCFDIGTIEVYEKLNQD